MRLLAHVEERGYNLRVEAPVDEALAARGSLQGWPQVPLLGYHFQMIADEYRNGAFDRALTTAIAQFKSNHGGKAPRVLDIGSGSGLLAMMAARAGASEVHSL